MNLKTALHTLLLLCIIDYVRSDGDWHYDNHTGKGSPRDWGKIDKNCDGKQQSPINIVASSTNYNSALQPIELKDFWDKTVPNMKYILKNTGHSVQVQLRVNGKYTESPIKTVFNGKTWTMAQLHFHWSGNNMKGSEHQINGKSFPVELHMIHINPKYQSISEAIPASDGLMVLGFFLQENDNTTDSAAYNYLFDQFKLVLYKDQQMDLNPLILSNLIPKEPLSNYYTYPGSLTTPGCQESVKWVVFDKPIGISSKQLEQLRALRSQNLRFYDTNPKDNPIIGRYRPVQLLHGRNVERNFNSAGVRLDTPFIVIVFTLVWHLFVKP